MPGEVDDRLMGLAIALGARNLGLTWPNPSVGAVVVAPDGRILAEGTTQPSGRPHAEVVALAQAGAKAAGATLYVSLEPCSHHGRTPPCAETIVTAGIARVVSALEDPDRRVAGRGHAMLRDAGIEVSTGVGSEAAALAHRGHIMRVTAGRPWTTLKLASTADGMAGRRDGPRLLLTGERANARTHMLRAHADAIMVGLETVRADDPRLDVRLPGLDQRRPIRIIIDSRLRLSSKAQVVVTAQHQPTWVICNENAPAPSQEILAAAGVEVVRVSAEEGGRVDLGAALRALASRGLTRVLCEGGPFLADTLAGLDLIDDIVLMKAASTFPADGSTGFPALGPTLAAEFNRRFIRVSSEVAAPDLVEFFERAVPCSPAS